jgi:dihydroorotase
MAEEAAGGRARPYDTVVVGGRVLDPAAGLDGRYDIGITGGKVSCVEPELDRAAAVRVIEAAGRIVTPGLVDLHTHVYWGATYWGIEADPVAARSGVTTWLDVGSAGAYSFPAFRRFIVEPSRVTIYALLNLSSIGLKAIGTSSWASRRASTTRRRGAPASGRCSWPASWRIASTCR